MEGRGITSTRRGHMPRIAQLANVIDLRAKMQVAQERFELLGVIQDGHIT